MDNISTRWGTTLPLQLTNDELGAVTATLTVSQNDILAFPPKTVNFDGMTADLTLSAEETELTPGLYNYMITIIYDDGTVEKYPDIDNCDGDCDLPTLEICDTNDNLEVS